MGSRGAAEDLVPRQLLIDANETVARLRNQLDEAAVRGRKEMEEAMRSTQFQIKTLQGQFKTTEDQLNRSMQRERDLREQLANSDVSVIITKLRRDIKEVREENALLETRIEKQRLAELGADSVKEELEAMKAEHERVLAAHEVAIKALRDDCDDTLAKAEEERNALVAEVETRMKMAMEELTSGEDRETQLQSEISELRTALEQAQAVVTATDNAARHNAERATSLEKDLALHRTWLQDRHGDMNSMEAASQAASQHAIDLEKDLSAEQERAGKLANELANTQEEMRQLHEATARVAQAMKLEIESQNSEMGELQRLLDSKTTAVNQAENDAKQAREQLREELRKCEAENKALRDNLRNERDLLEKTMREHSSAVSEALEQRQRIEAAANKREDALTRRCQHAERELDDLRVSSVPETHLRQLRDELKKEKEEVVMALQKAREEAKRSDEHYVSVISRLELRVAEAEGETSQRAARVKVLEQQCREFEAQARSDRKHLVQAQAQVRSLSGDPEEVAGIKGKGLKPTMMAETALRSMEGILEECATSIIRSVPGKLPTAGDGKQKSALGLVVTEGRVDSTIPGSPAQMCGIISKDDEVMMVDGSRVTSATVGAALRGDDVIGSVALLTMRRSATGEVYEVQLPRVSVDAVQQRNELDEVMAKLRSEAAEAAVSGNRHVLLDRFAQLSQAANSVEMIGYGTVSMLSGQVVALRKALDDSIAKSRAAILDVDATHQHVLMMQNMTETELREQISYGQRARDPEEASLAASKSLTIGGASQVDLMDLSLVHKQVQELEGDLQNLQDELSASQMARKELQQDADVLRAKLEAAEERIEAFGGGQKSMRGMISSLEEQVADARAEANEHAFCAGVKLNCNYDTHVRDTVSRGAFDAQLREDICLALKVPKANVNVMSHHRGSLIAEIKFNAILPAGGVGHVRTGRMLATEFVDMFKPGGNCAAIKEGSVGQHITEVELHGPISEGTATAFRSCLSERDRDAFWLSEEMRKAEEKLKAVEESNWAAIEHLERQIQFVKAQHEDEVRSAIESKMGESAEAMLVVRQEMMHHQQNVIAGYESKHKAEIEQLTEGFMERLLRSEGIIDERAREIDVMRHQINQLEVALSLTRKGVDHAKDSEKIAAREREKYINAMRQVNDLLVPEIRSCASTLNNIESEMGFFHAYHMRALSIANVTTGTVEEKKTQDDASKSKEMMQRDIETLRGQLEALAACSYSDPFVLGEQLADTISNSDRSRGNISFATPQSRGGMVSVRASPPTAAHPQFAITSSGTDGKQGSVSVSRPLSMPEWGPRIPGSGEVTLGRSQAGQQMACCMLKVEVVGGADLPAIDVLAPAGSVTFAVLLSAVQGTLDVSAADHAWPGGKAAREDGSKPALVLDAQHHTRDQAVANGPVMWDESFVVTHSQHGSLGSTVGSDGKVATVYRSLDGQPCTLLVTLHKCEPARDPVSLGHTLVQCVNGVPADKWYALDAWDGTPLRGKGNKPASVRLRVSYTDGRIASPQKGEVSMDGSYVC